MEGAFAWVCPVTASETWPQLRTSQKQKQYSMPPRISETGTPSKPYEKQALPNMTSPAQQYENAQERKVLSAHWDGHSLVGSNQQYSRFVRMALVPFSYANPFVDQLRLEERLFTIDGQLLRIQQVWS